MGTTPPCRTQHACKERTELSKLSFLRLFLRHWNKKMGKDKKNESLAEGEDKVSYEEKLKYVSVIAKPMASKKLTKKLYKCIKKGIKHKTYVRNGLKDVQARIRKVCEEKGLPYCYTPSRQDLGTAMGVKRGSLMVLIKEHEDYKDVFEECKKEMETLPVPSNC